jgi:hypothetical protein
MVACNHSKTQNVGEDHVYMYVQIYHTYSSTHVRPKRRYMARNMYVCMCVCMYVCICIHVYEESSIHVCMYINMYTYARNRLCTYAVDVVVRLVYTCICI